MSVCLELLYRLSFLTFCNSSNPIPCRQVPRLERKEEEEEGKFIIAPIFVLTGDEDRQEEKKGHSDESISGGGERGCFTTGKVVVGIILVLWVERGVKERVMIRSGDDRV